MNDSKAKTTSKCWICAENLSSSYTSGLWFIINLDKSQLNLNSQMWHKCFRYGEILIKKRFQISMALQNLIQRTSLFMIIYGLLFTLENDKAPIISRRYTLSTLQLISKNIKIYFESIYQCESIKLIYGKHSVFKNLTFLSTII